MKQGTGSQLGKEYVKAVYCHPANLTYMQRTSWENTGLEEAQAGIKIAERNINNLRYADDTTLTAESQEELKPLDEGEKREWKSTFFVNEKESEKLKLNIQKPKIMASDPITSWQINGEIMETVTDFIFLGSKITVGSDCSHEIKRRLHQEAWALLVAQLVKNLPGK